MLEALLHSMLATGEEELRTKNVRMGRRNAIQRCRNVFVALGVSSVKWRQVEQA